MLLAGMLHAQPTYSVKLELLPVFTSPDSVVIAAMVQSNPGTLFKMEAVYVTVSYDPGAFTVDDTRLIMNRRFATNNWSDDCLPYYDHDLVFPDLAMYGESSPNFVAVQLAGPPAHQLCTFTFFPIMPDGTTNFTVVGNTTSAATTGYYIPNYVDNQLFTPVIELINWYYDVELQSFTAFQQGRGVTLKWTTVAETNNSGFHIQRRPAGSEAWTDIQFVKGGGTMRQQQEYLAFDFGLTQSGRYEYRLRQVDFDGSETFSRLAMVNYMDRPGEFSLGASYPNPVISGAGGQTSIPFSIAERSELSLVVTDALGRDVAVLRQGTVEQGGYTALWSPNGLPAGLYFVTMHATGLETGRSHHQAARIQVMR